MNQAKKNEVQRQRRKTNGNLHTKLYEKTKNGFLMRMYRNMKSRISGIQKSKFHLYKDRHLCSKESFYQWALQNESFHKLFAEYESSGYEQRLAPSVDRIDSTKGYEFDNMEFVTHGINSGRSGYKKRKRIIQLDLSGNKIAEWDSLQIAADNLGCNISGISICLHGKTKTSAGFKWAFAE